MEKIQYQSVEVDRCTGCKGLWFDLMEGDMLKAIAGSEAIDIGDPSVGKLHNKIDKIDCPVCLSPMFEKCSDCSGMFLDAGEFRDLKDDNLIDFIKDLFQKPRKWRGLD
jgi:Zn-finger nucleic acid-binding protein